MLASSAGHFPDIGGVSRQYENDRLVWICELYEQIDVDNKPFHVLADIVL